MEFKNWILDRLFGVVLEEESGEEAQAEDSVKQEDVLGSAKQPVQEEEPEQEAPRRRDSLGLSLDHPFIRLYELWAEEVRDAPLPHLRLDHWEDTPDGVLEQELAGLRKAFTLVAADRLEKISEWRQKKDMADKQRALLEKLKAAKEEKGQLTEEEEALLSGKGGITQEILEVLPLEMDALPLVYITRDQLAAWLIVFPPVGAGKELEKSMLEKVLGESSVSFGVDAELMENLSGKEDRYFHLFQIAKGQPVLHGKDGYIEEFFERTVKQKFAENEHGKVDYFNLNLVQNVEKGEVICRSVPPVEGVSGRTVQNKEISCRTGKAVQLPKGQNTEISKDGTELLAVKSGRVEFSGRGFQVKSVLEISGNVDFSTGNINFVGDVHIHGDVSSGFRVHTIGDITIDGVVEAAEIEAGGNLIVAKGISGDSRAVIRAHHDIYAMYMENCSVHSNGNIQTDCIVNCDVYCDGEIQVRSGRGTIVGGRVRAARGVSSKIVGSRSESITTISLGGQPCADYERESLLQSLDALEKEMEKVEKQPESPARTKRMAKIRLDLSVGRMKLGRFDKELKKIQEQLEEQGGSKLKCDVAYPGMILNIGEETMHLTKETSMVHARMFNGEIILM